MIGFTLKVLAYPGSSSLNRARRIAIPTGFFKREEASMSVAGTKAIVQRVLLFAILLMVPAVASAQSAISGLVRDTTGAVLPGVTVEASSPVLIERVRTATTDDQGRYTISDLRPGTYEVTFTLPGSARSSAPASSCPRTSRCR